MPDFTAQNQQILRAHVFISGRVQGVGYRMSTLSQAKRLGVNGWVRNLADRRVEAVLEGEPTAVEQMISWCRQGPPGAVVKDVSVDYEAPEGLDRFEIISS